MCDSETRYNVSSLESDIELVERIKGTYDMDSPEFYNALDNILNYVNFKKEESTN